MIYECSGDIAGVIMPNIVVFCSVPNLFSEWSFHNVEFIPISFGTISDFPLTVTLRLECMRIKVRMDAHYYFISFIFTCYLCIYVRSNFVTSEKTKYI